MKNYVRKILLIIFLTSLPFLALLPVSFFFELKIKYWAYLLGAFASAINFWLLYKNADTLLQLPEAEAKVKSLKGFFLRFGVIVIYSIVCVGILKTDIVLFGLGLLSAQFSIYLEWLYRLIKEFDWSKYLRR